MKRVTLLCVLFLCALSSNAQFSVEGNTSPVKFKDVVARYHSENPAPPKSEDEEIEDAKLLSAGPVKGRSLFEAEEHDYQFDRWKWYWQQHLDPDGYMVSPVKTWNEWENFSRKTKAEKTTATMAAWSFVGPDSSGANGSGVGRITVVAFHPTVASTYWIGSPGGGAWKTTDNGLHWTCMTDQLPLLSVSDIVFNPKNPNTIYICTGDKDGNNYFSTGVIKSYDGGATWSNTGLVWSESSMLLANSMVINPSDTNTLVLGSTSGVYISHNGGTTWKLTASSSGQNMKQVLYNPTDTNIIYATSRFNTGTSAPAQIYRSADGGTTWTKITSFTDAFRIQLAVTPASPNTVKAVVSASDVSNKYGLYGIYNSTDAGLTYSQIYAGGCSGSSNLLSFNQDGTGCGGQGFYDITIAISPTNANNVYVGGINAWRSTNGGSSWSIMTQWSPSLPGVTVIHADKHFMAFEPLVPGRFFECNDGGVYYSDNPTTAGPWKNITNGLGITEFYRVAVSDLATYEIAGAQDNGTKVEQGGLSQDLLGGDGMECQLDPLDTNTAYAATEYGNIVAFTGGGASTISNNIPGTPTGGWVTPYVLEPSCNICLLAGYQDVYMSPDQGASWSDISGPLTSGDLLRVSTSLSDPNTIYAVEDGTENIFYTHTGGSPWTTITAPYSGGIISDLKVDQFDPTKIWVTFSGYSSPQVSSYSPSAGWVSFKTGLPDVPVNCINIDITNRIKYIGTDIGVFFRDTTMTSWLPYQTGMPVVRVNDLQFDYATNKIWAATYGRSLWSSGRQTTIGGVSLGVAPPVATGFLNVIPNPNHGSFTVTLGSGANGNAALRLINSVGATVWQQSGPVNGNSLQVHTGDLAPGMYILEVSNSNSIDRKKVVIY